MPEPTRQRESIDWARLNDLFERALLLDPAERRRFAVDECGSDTALCDELRAMLDAEQAAERRGFLKDAIFSGGASALAFDDETLPERIGDYRVIGDLGRGGMGIVYLAEHVELKQKAAVKVIKRGMDTDEVLRRFKVERQVMAALQHPNIARLLNGGTTDDGRPFFVMEYVEGVPVTTFCDENRLNIDDRLRLFAKICSAVSFAHKNLIIHRDIKPSNILVGTDGEPKLLDFGISKILSDEVVGVTLAETALGMRMMTPEYASPEQVAGAPITTASDIYSLGVLLYELMSGHRPIELAGCSRADISKFIAESEPDAPSTAAVRPRETGREITPETLAEFRNERPDRLRRRLSGDLDNIVLMSLRKEPERRYGSVMQFAEDIERHLTGMPVMARPASFGYLASKFIERHRPQTAAAAAIAVAVLLGFGAAMWQWNAAAAERDRANQRFEQVRQLSNSLISGWDDGLDEAQVSHEARARLIAISAEFLDSLAAQTREPELLAELAEAYLKLGHEFAYQSIDIERARESLANAESIARRLNGEIDDGRYRDLLVRVLYKQDEFFGDTDLQASLENRLERLALRERNLTLAPNDEPAVRWYAAALADVANGMLELGHDVDAREYFLRSIDGYRQRIQLLDANGSDPEAAAKMASTYATIADHYANRLNDIRSAEAAISEAAAIAQRSLEKDLSTGRNAISAVSVHFLSGSIREKAGDTAASEQAYAKAAELAREQLKRGSWSFLARKEYDAYLSLAELAVMRGDRAEALALIERSRESRRKWEAADTNRNNARSRHSGAIHSIVVGKLLISMGETSAGRQELERAAAVLTGVIEESDPMNRKAVRHLAGVYAVLGDSYAGVGLCSGSERPFGGITEQIYYCRPGNLQPSNRSQLNAEAARSFYKRSEAVFARLESSGILTAIDREHLAAVRVRADSSGEIAAIKN
ncbi:MAG: serine/threonine protein kinase [Acidobacteriota bacterium]|nr:MAG: serine/threonine protein kinase [Acidobacteriota bacterium]